VVSLTGRERAEFLTTVARPRLDRLVEVAMKYARPWSESTLSESTLSENTRVESKLTVK
jgi:hypothetical protein